MRYLLFASDAYCPSGGWRDYVGAYETCEKAIEAAKVINISWSWWHVVDMETTDIVWEEG